ncbi:hypothetical protein [Neobacillus citreus]|uniref:Sporulation protein n=1 Tax=Neobacillus citreus TaxID=2833578 RepID=A0A942T872_9BACI|nr:hypothetical protein [Neobacillus citreus]MCH6268614.1 hypothetical protein [Neobacillus citreus]
MKKWMFLVGIILLLATGCQNGRSADDDAANDLRGDRQTRNLVSNHDINDQHMVEDDVTNQNPNFLDLTGTGSGSEAGANNQGNDIAKAKQVIADTHEFVTDSVWINGDRMWVKVYKKGMLSSGDKRDAEARLHKKLMRALPRYNIEVNVQEDRR